MAITKNKLKQFKANLERHYYDLFSSWINWLSHRECNDPQVDAAFCERFNELETHNRRLQKLQHVQIARKIVAKSKAH